jgi:hypothetical protein
MKPFDEIMKKWDWKRFTPRRTDGEIESLIRSFERQIGEDLPSDYRAFLTRYDGVSIGRGCADLLEPGPTDGIISIETFFGFHALEDNGSPRSYDLEYEWDIFANYGPNKLLPIATGCGEKICISLVGSDRGCVYYQDRDHLELTQVELNRMVETLKQHGVDLSLADMDMVVYEAEKISPNPNGKPPGYSNLYLFARDFSAFLESIRIRD